jgi:Peptidase family M28
VEYFIGPRGDFEQQRLVVHRSLMLDWTDTASGDYMYLPIYNVTGTIEGATEETVILGNHHDSWCCGAIDPISGSIAMHEVARGLGRLNSIGWKPERKISAPSPYYRVDSILIWVLEFSLLGIMRNTAW